MGHIPYYMSTLLDNGGEREPDMISANIYNLKSGQSNREQAYTEEGD